MRYDEDSPSPKGVEGEGSSGFATGRGRREPPEYYQMKKDSCEYCDGKVDCRHIRAPFHYKNITVYIDHIPAWVCAKCGERYFDAPVYKQLEMIARHRSKIRKKISFPLADFRKVA